MLRVNLPFKDIKEMVRYGQGKAHVDELLGKARPFILDRARVATSMTLTPEPASREPDPVAEPPPAQPAADAPSATVASPAPVADDELTFTFGERVYQLDGEPERSRRTLLVTLKVTGHGKAPFIDTLNLYSDRARATLISRLFTIFRGEGSEAGARGRPLRDPR